MYDVFVGYLWRLDLVIHEIDKQRRFTIFQNILFVFIRKLGVFTKYFVLQTVVFCTISMSKYGIFGYLYKQPLCWHLGLSFCKRVLFRLKFF